MHKRTIFSHIVPDNKKTNTVTDPAILFVLWSETSWFPIYMNTLLTEWHEVTKLSRYFLIMHGEVYIFWY